MAAGISLHSTYGELGSDAEATATFVQRCNNIFDIFNSSSKQGT